MMTTTTIILNGDKEVCVQAKHTNTTLLFTTMRNGDGARRRDSGQFSSGFHVEAGDETDQRDQPKTSVPSYISNQAIAQFADCRRDSLLHSRRGNDACSIKRKEAATLYHESVKFDANYVSTASSISREVTLLSHSNWAKKQNERDHACIC